MIALYGADWLTATEVAERYGDDISADMLCDWKRRGLIRGATVGGRAHYRADDVEEAEMITREQARGRRRRGGGHAA